MVPRSRRYFGGEASGSVLALERCRRSLPAGEDRAKVLLERASITWNQQGGDDAFRMITQALDEAVTPSLRAQIPSCVSWITEDFEQGLEHAEAALSLTEHHHIPILYSFILHNLSRL